jgi:phosphate starvation-inducible protein PhoH and related proteins
MSKNRNVESISYAPLEETASKRIGFRPRHWQQTAALECCAENAITFLTGPAGTAKTYVATYYALSGALADTYRRVIIARPAVTQGVDIGWLPGDVEQKMAPFIKPFIDSYKKMAGFDKAKIDEISKLVEIMPLCYIRGVTIEEEVMIVDEAQNLSGKEIMTIIKRLGAGGKIIFCGDTDQTDIDFSYLEHAAKDLDGFSRRGRTIGWHKFTPDAIVRDPLVSLVVEHEKEFAWAR